MASLEIILMSFGSFISFLLLTIIFLIVKASYDQKLTRRIEMNGAPPKPIPYPQQKPKIKPIYNSDHKIWESEQNGK